MDRCPSLVLRMSTIAAILLACVWGRPAGAAPISFDGDCGNGDWLAACGGKTNWTTDGLPGSGDDASAGATFDLTLKAQGAAVTVRSVDISGGLTIEDRDLSLQTASSIHDLDLSRATVTSALASGSGGGTALRLNGQSILREGSVLRGSPSLATFRNNEDLSVLGSLRLDLALLLNAAALTQRGRLTLEPGAVARNQGTWLLDGDDAGVGRASVADPETARFENTGSLRNEAGDNSIDVTFVSDSGSVAVDADSLAFSRNASFGSALAISTGARLILNAPSGVTHTLRNRVTVGGRGQLLVTSGGGRQIIEGEVINALDATTGGVSFEAIDLAITSSASLSNRGLLRWGTGGVAGGQIAGAGTIANEATGLLRLDAATALLGVPLTNAGQIGQDGTLTLADAAFPSQVALSNERNGVWRLEHAVINSVGTGRLRNRGTIVAPVNGGTSVIAVPLDLLENGALLVEADAALLLRGGGSWGAAHPIDVRGAVRLQSEAGQPPRVYNVASAGTFSGDGDIYVDSGTTLRVAEALSSATSLHLVGGVISGPGVLTNTSRLELVSGTLGDSNGAEISLSNAGLVQVRGPIAVTSSSQLVNASSDLENGAGWFVGPAAEVSLASSSQLWSSGAIVFLGTNRIDGDGTVRNTGRLIRGQTDVDDSAGTTTIASTFSNTGTVHVIDGTLNLTGPLVQLVDGRIDEGTWRVADGAELTAFDEVTTIGANAVVEIPSNNLGSLFDGLRRVEGRLTVGDNLRAASLTVAAGGILATNGAIGGAVHQVGISLDGGTLVNHGRIEPGAEAVAVVTIGGAFDQQSDGTLRVDLRGAGSDRLVVSGPASVAGRLEVVLPPGVVPDPSDEFTILTADRVSGTFDGVGDRVAVVDGSGSFAVRYTADSIELSNFEVGPLPTATATRAPTAIPTPTATRRPGSGCGGDCDLDLAVTVDEILKGVNIALGTVPLSACEPFDRNDDRAVTVDEIVSAVNAALVGCPK